MHGKDGLRRCGLIYVALIDLRAGELPNGPLTRLQTPREAVAGIRRLLREALYKSADEVPPAFARLADGMRAFAASIV